jgi:hypothetical protein
VVDGPLMVAACRAGGVDVYAVRHIVSSWVAGLSGLLAGLVLLTVAAPTSWMLEIKVVQDMFGLSSRAIARAPTVLGSFSTDPADPAG